MKVCSCSMFIATLCSNESLEWWISPQPLKQAISRPQRLWHHAALRPCIMWAICSLKSYCEKRVGFFFPLNAPLQTTKQIRLKVSPKITGLQQQPGRGLWQKKTKNKKQQKKKHDWPVGSLGEPAMTWTFPSQALLWSSVEGQRWKGKGRILLHVYFLLNTNKTCFHLQAENTVRAEMTSHWRPGNGFYKNI